MELVLQKRLFTYASNYLEYGDTHYICSSKGAIYKAADKKTTLYKIIRIASWALLFTYATAYIIRAAYQPSIQPSVFAQKRQQQNPSAAQVIATANCRDTQAWRKKLIQTAQHNIVISGNYCDGKEFDDILNCIALRMKEVPELRVVIIAHPKFVRDDPSKHVKNKQLLKQLSNQYKDRFLFIASPNTHFGYKNVTNHTKCFLIDYGTYFIQGGSGIRDNFAAEGTIRDQEKPSAKKTSDDTVIYSHKREKGRKVSFQDDIRHFSKAHRLSLNAANGSFMDKMLPTQFRDQDFVFHSEDSNHTVYRELLYLALKWRDFKETGSISSESWDIDLLNASDPLFVSHPALKRPSDTPPLQSSSNNALDYLLQTSIPQNISTRAPLDFSQKAIQDVSMRFFFTGPEDRQSIWEETLIRRIENAQSRIVIDQMYFHPTDRLMKAISNAASRNIKITVVTATGGKTSAKSERFFGHRNIVTLSRLYDSVDAAKRKNLSFHSFKQARNGLHKKIAIIDDFVCAGSSNMGQKSLSLTGDHEMNFEAQSKQLAEATLAHVNEDIRLSKKNSRLSPTILNRFLAWIHAQGANTWG